MYSGFNGTLMEKCLSLAYEWFFFKRYPAIRDSITPAVLLNTEQNLSPAASGRAPTPGLGWAQVFWQQQIIYPYHGPSACLLAIPHSHCPLNCLTTFSNAFQFQQIIKHMIAITLHPLLVRSSETTPSEPQPASLVTLCFYENSLTSGHPDSCTQWAFKSQR